jgi:demethylmenaquinone methyltransferase/2-methoxy-6-polyprenyl-1,4-benzoquinol methylase
LNGKALILELSLPKNFFVRAIYLFYFRHCLPLVAGFLTGDKRSYRYLVDSTESFFSPEDFVRLMKNAGFGEVVSRKLTLGIAYLYQGKN